MTIPTAQEEAETLRSRLYRNFEPTAWHGSGLSPVNQVMVGLVLVSVALFVLGTEPSLSEQWGGFLQSLDLSVAVLFALEYGARLWAAGEIAHYRGWRGRLRWVVRPMSLIDLVSFLPTLLFLGASDTFILRMLRLLRLFRIAKLGRYSTSILLVELTVRRCRRELAVTLAIAACVLLVSATLLWIAEADAQPETFGSIPRALWWSVVTLTTVGYGDVYPLTVAGRILGGLVALIGIGMIAMPAGILSGSFVEASRVLRRRRRLFRRIQGRRLARRP